MPALTVAPQPAERSSSILQSAAQRSPDAPPLRVDGLRRSYGSLEAVRGISFEVRAGEIFGLLGPNGAGKTTTISMIATQLRPSGGSAHVYGHDVVRDVAAVRLAIGFAPQEIASYPHLTAAENVRFFGRMFGIRGDELQRRAVELLQLVELDYRGEDEVSTFSGGMKRRLNLAISLVHQPRLVLLDEPTVGVDPHSREHIFQIVRNLRDEGRAILYTTHYMEEAEALCDRIAIVDEGQIITMGHLNELLAEAGCAEVIELRGLPHSVDLGMLENAGCTGTTERYEGGVRILTQNAVRALPAITEVVGRYADTVSVHIAPLSLQTLFMRLTGKELRD